MFQNNLGIGKCSDLEAGVRYHDFLSQLFRLRVTKPFIAEPLSAVFPVGKMFTEERGEEGVSRLSFAVFFVLVKK